MISRVNIILVVVLVAQVGLIGIRALSTSDSVGTTSRGLLLDGIDLNNLVSLRIEAADDTVSVERDGPQGKWRVAELFGYDADRTKVERTLRELAALEIADVVSTSGAHHEDLKVSATSFDRKVTLTSAGTSAGTGDSVEILFGSSGRANSVHVRKADAPTVYSVRDFSAWKLSAQADAWIDRTYFSANRQEVQRLAMKNQHGAFSVERDGPKDWTLIFSDGRRVPANADAVDDLLGKATTVSIMEVTGKRADNLLSPPVTELRFIMDEHGEDSATDGAADTESTAAATRVLRIAKKPGNEERYLLHADNAELVGEASKWSVQALLDAKASELVADEPSVEPATP